MTKLVVDSLIKQANKIIITQSVIVLLLAVVFFAVSGSKAGAAALVGGFVYVLPGYLYASRLFANVSPSAIKRIIVVFYIGEILKLVVSVGLFIGLYHTMRFPLLPYFLGYLVAALSFCIAPMWLINRNTM